MKRSFTALAILSLLAGCATITFGPNPEPPAKDFIESLKSGDGNVSELVVDSSSEKSQEISRVLKKLKEESKNPAAKAGADYLDKLSVEKCFMGESESLCRLSDGSDLVLERSGWSWKVNLDRSDVVANLQEKTQALFRAEQTPETVAINFTVALIDGDLEMAKEYSTEKTHLLLPLIVGMMKMARTEEQAAKFEEAKKELQSMKCEIQGDKAQCAPEGKSKPMDLVREEGIWKVEMKKGGNEDSEDEPEEPSMDDSEP
ncbi:MAG: DUF4878 domain-containing protein [Leptospiraceae bacterium]|nr:DUF4878 domain-containing protein [Leptospiraceae bacterium]